MSIHFQIKVFDSLSLQELYQIMVLRQEVFVVEQDCPYLDADGKDEVSLHVVGYHDNRLVAYSRIVPKGISYEKYASIGRVVTHPSVRGKGVGKLLMKQSIQACQKAFGNHIKIKISAQSHLTGFYDEFGFKTVGEGYLEDGIPHIGMIL